MSESGARRLAWSICIVAVAAMVADLVLYLITPQELLRDDLRQTGADVADELANLGLPLIGALIASRRRENPLGWILLAAGAGLALSNVGFAYAVYALEVREGAIPGGYALNWLSGWTWTLAIGSLPFLLLLFPTGRLHSRRWRPVLWASVVCGAVLFLTALVGATLLWDRPFVDTEEIATLPGVISVLIVAVYASLVLGILGLVSTFARFRVARGDERLQLRWFALAATAFVGAVVFTQFGERLTSAIAFTIAAVGLYSAIGIAILKYRLYEIDLVINKTVVYGALAAFITLVYVAIVVGVGTVAGGGENLLLSIVATALIAVAFQPARRWAQRLANRVVYGQRATPYEVLTGFSHRLGDAYSVEDVLPRMARVLAEGIGAERVVVWLLVGAEFRPAGTWPDTGGAASTDRPPEDGFDVRHQGEILGSITVDMPRNEPMTPVQEKLATDVAAQAGLVLRNAALITDLRASRQRLVAAQDEERRKIERNIHDGAQQQLVALAVKLKLADALVGKDEERAHGLLAELQAETSDALDDLRDLARGIYPPLLADKGLAAALETQARKSSVPVTIEPHTLGRYDQAVEAAVYFCSLEALQNVAKYAGASAATIRLAQANGQLTFQVSDDGRGFDPAATHAGSGLTNMADRLAALGGRLEISSSPGGGTTIAGSVPLGEAP